MKRTLRFTATAVDDLASIRHYIRRQDPQAAQRIMNGFRNLFRLLIKNPGMGELRTGVPQPNIRSMSIGNYVMYFRQHAAVVEVIRIMHGAQDKPAIE